MPIWTPGELELLNKAVAGNDHGIIGNLVNLYKQRTKVPSIKNNHPILIAAQENNGALLQYFLSNQTIDSKTINNCIEISLLRNHLEVFKVLFSKENQIR